MKFVHAYEKKGNLTLVQLEHAHVSSTGAPFKINFYSSSSTSIEYSSSSSILWGYELRHRS